MARPKVNLSALAVSLLLLSGLVAADECDPEISLRKLKKASKRCITFIDKNRTDPLREENIPEECCTALKGADVACMCSFVPDFVYDYMSMERFVFAVQTCSDTKLRVGSKCGNYVVPPPGLLGGC